MKCSFSKNEKKFALISSQKKSEIARNFSQKSLSYNRYASIQRLANIELINQIIPFLKPKNLIADLGSGTSFFAKNLLNREKLKNFDFRIFEIDLAIEMLQFWISKPNNVFSIVADFENLPFRKNTFDIISSSFALQWIDNLEEFFCKTIKLLKDDGKLVLCLPTNDSLHQLRDCKSFYLNDFPKSDSIINHAVSSGFNLENETSAYLRQKFDNKLSALRWIKLIGANSKKTPIIYSKNRNIVITNDSLNLDKEEENSKESSKFESRNSLIVPKKPYFIHWHISYFIFKKNV